MITIIERLQAVRKQIRAAENDAGRIPNSVLLLAVSKAHPAEAVRAAYVAGQQAFGENYLQEALAKQKELGDLTIAWHFIGPLQSNKTQAVAQHFSWVHSVDRLKIAERLSAARPANMTPLQLCLQLNVSGEASKGGVAVKEAVALAQAIAKLPRLQLRGLMAIPAPTSNIAIQRQQFRLVRELYETMQAQGLTLDALSMGMSADFAAAIAEGATMIRIGSAIFGARPTTEKQTSQTINT